MLFPNIYRLFFLLIFCCSLVIPINQGLCQSDAKEKSYHLGRGDVVMISITAGGEEQIKADMVVGDDGNVNVPFVGKTQASGMTMGAFEKAILIPLERDFFVAPQIHLKIKEYHSLQFFISGAVKNPGMFKLDFIPTLMDLVASAGGVLPERGDMAYILRGDITKDLDEKTIEDKITKKTPIKVNLIKILDEGDMSENIMLKSGDTVYIPLGQNLNQSRTKIYVEGKVKRPGVFDFQPGLTAFAACIMAGGFDKFAAPGRTKIIRQTETDQETIKINLDKVQTGEISDFELKPGDRIHVPESWL
ncbi:MAG: SLBB domain-containing protein [Desulfobacterium sp.]|nr:SLBB domain-containing protein [Desulfobacterium sp.]